jgi:hypothetical protein
MSTGRPRLGGTVRSEFGRLLAEAIRRKAQETGRYSLRDLQRDSGNDFTYPSKVIRMGLTPSREAIEAWSRALHPYLPLEEALIAAGYIPERGPWRQALLDAVRSTAEQRTAELGRWLTRVPQGAEELADQAVEGKRRDHTGEKQDDGPPATQDKERA